eukprot:163875_1
MADDVIFEKEDRVKVISGKLKGSKGYVRYVGPVESKDIIYVGVELDEPNGKHDGKAKGKRYFKCRNRHGYMAPHETFELFGKSKQKLRNRRLTKLPNSISRGSSKASSPTTTAPLKNTQSTKTSRDRSSIGGRRKLKTASSNPVAKDKKPKRRKSKHSILNPTDSINDLNLSLNPTDMNRMVNNISPSPTPVVTQITYKDQEVQTEMALSVVNDDNDIATVSKEVAEGYQSMVQSLRTQMSKLNDEITELKQKNLKLDNGMLSKNDMIEMMLIEKEAMTEDCDYLKNKMEENEILIGHLELDIDDMKEERVRLRNEFISELESGAQDVNQILLQNQVLAETLRVFKQTALTQIQDKNNEILNLSLKCKTIPSLLQHIKQLEDDLSIKQNVENELIEFKREIDLRSNSDQIIEILSTKNVELEYELKRLNEVNKHLEKLRSIHDETEQENEEYIFDLNEEMKCKDSELDDMTRKLDKVQKELRHAQNTVFQFKDHIRRLEDTKRRMMRSTNNAMTDKKEERLQKEMLLRTNLELLNKIDSNKHELINYTQIAATGFSHSLENMILKQHIPNNVNIDYGAMQCLSFLQRIAFKVRFCKEVLDLFYIWDHSAMGGDIASSSDIGDMYKVLELCPILVKQDRFIEAIQRALTASYVDKFNEAVTHYATLVDVEERYDALLAAVQANDIRSRINIADIHRCDALFRAFLMKYFAEFNFEQKLRKKDMIDKWALYDVLQQLKYNLYGMQFKSREINDRIAALSGATQQEEEEEDEDVDLLMNGKAPPRQRQLLFGVLQKMEELQSHVVEITRRSLQYCAPSRCMFVGVKNNLKRIADENHIGIEFDFVESTAHMMRALVTKQNVLLEALNSMETRDADLSDFERIGKMNRLLDEESESSSNGLVPCLEKLYKHVKRLPYALEQLYTTRACDHTTEKELNAIALGQIQTDKLYCMHEELERELMKEKHRKEKALIRTAADSDEKEDEDEIAAPPWVDKAKVIKCELEKADIVRDALESAQAEIKYKHKELLLEKSATAQIKSRLEVVKLELAKQHTISRTLVHFELEARDAETKLSKSVDSNKKLKVERDKLMKKGHELESKLTSYQNTLKSMKLASNRKKIKNVHHEEEEEHHHHHHRSKHHHSSLRRTSSVNLNKHRRGSSLNLQADNFKLERTISATTDTTDDRRVISQLHKQLDLNKNYTKLLEKTINSLRHSHHIYDLNRQWMEIKRDLRVLPSFESMNAAQMKVLFHKEQHLANEAKMRHAQTKKERAKLLCGAEEEDDELDADGEKKKKKVKEDARGSLGIVSSFKHKEMKKKRYATMHDALHELDAQFGVIYSAPNMVDLQKNKRKMDYSQSLIGRNLKLRELKLKCHRLSKQCKQIESNFLQQTPKQQKCDDQNRSNLSVLGRIDIEGLNDHPSHKTNVCLNRNNVTKLQNYLNLIC